MKTLWLKHDYKKQAAALEGKFADPSNATHILSKDTRVITPDGSIAAIFLRGVVPTTLHLRAYELLRTVKDLVSNRATAMGTASLPRSVNRMGIASPPARSERNCSEGEPCPPRNTRLEEARRVDDFDSDAS